ncbi:MAG TPA: DUF3472 domain-containing protein [Candidatus Acidoferrales bacterium]|nr:DUF3472 domain-containing protein [Candidatus Acidoferrales bacterium]
MIARYLVSLAFLMCVAPIAHAQNVVWKPLYPKPPYDRVDWTLTVLELSDKRSFYYWAFQDGFVGGGVFYFGLQPYGACPGGGNCKMALFSFFGRGSTSTSRNCKPGADNGPGMSCHIRYNWRIGAPYRFSIRLAATDPTGRTETWTGTVTDMNSGRITEIGNWTLPGQNSAAPGLIGAEALSFTEYYRTPKNGCAAQPYAKVEMSVPTGYRGATPDQGGVQSTNPSKNCAESVHFSLRPNEAAPTSVAVETGSVR